MIGPGGTHDPAAQLLSFSPWNSCWKVAWWNKQMFRREIFSKQNKLSKHLGEFWSLNWRGVETFFKKTFSSNSLKKSVIVFNFLTPNYHNATWSRWIFATEKEVFFSKFKNIFKVENKSYSLTKYFSNLLLVGSYFFKVLIVNVFILRK
jgi:hypothetical protein